MNLNNISQFYTKQLFYDLELCVILNTRWLFRCMLDVFVMMAKLLTYECKALPANNIVLFTVRVCTDLIHWLLHLCCRNWGLPSWQNWFREGSQGANDTWNDYYEKEIKCPYSSETSLSTNCSAAFGQGLRAGRKATAGGTSTPIATSGSLTPRSTSCRGRWGGFWENKLLVELYKRGDSVGTRTNYKRT